MSIGRNVVAVAFLVAVSSVWAAEEPAAVTPPDASAAPADDSIETVAPSTDAQLHLNNPQPEEALDRFWFVCTTNYHNNLTAAERQIDRMINDTMSVAFFPDWERVRTFQDWRDEYRIWDLSLGYGQDIDAHWSWSVYGGGGAGTVKNGRIYNPFYTLFAPTELHLDFTRISGFIGSSIVWHPWGRPEYTGPGLRAALAQIRPCFEMNIGASYQVSQADVKINLPVIGKLAEIKQDDRYLLGWTSPRAGIELPLTQRDSLNILAGYLWFNNQSDDFNGYLFEFYVRHRF